MTVAVATPRPKVLVVDDQPANLLVACKILQKLPVETLTARSGTEALGLLLRNEFAVILLDVRMPGMDGYETATLIREHTEAEPVPIIFVTAEASEQEAVVQGYESGAVDYLLKPIDEKLLLRKLRVFLDLYDHRRRLAQAKRELTRSTQRLERLLDAVGDGIIGLDHEGRVGFANPAACRLLGGTSAQLLAGAARDLMCEGAASALAQAAARGELRSSGTAFRTLRGAEVPVEYVLSALDGEGAGAHSYVLVFRDIGERLQAERELRRRAEADHLTGLANRMVFEQKLRQVLGRPGGANRPFALLLLDLDGFKQVNDTHGHAVGDVLLKRVGERLQESMRTADLPARLGGDEFAVFLDGIREPADALAIGEKVRRALSAPYDCDGVQLEVGASVGVALHPHHADSIAGLLEAADAAMYRAKRDPARQVVMAEAAGPGKGQRA
jgi:diguanylate cyclase (GGDEF)-like protein/PAS domain S-box-containing protein